jgi:hypothetical protein
MEAAIPAARRASNALNKSLAPYENCPCGWIHLTSRKGPKVNEPALGDGPVDDVTFALVVRDEVVGRAAEEDAEKLRSPVYLLRWADALKTFQIDLGAQMAEKRGLQDAATREWRKRIRKVESGLAERRAEAKNLTRENHICLRNDKGRGRSPDVVERRRVAGERAIRRLKDAHPDEFMTYLAEEYAAEGLPLGGKLAEYAPKGDE